MKRIIVDLKFHVPTFMFMAFYFYSKHIISKDIAKIKQRFIRLFVPYIIWPILIFIFNNSFLSLIGKGQFKKYLTIQDLIQQLILGIKFHYVFWFQINIILLTFLFTIIYFCLNKNIQFILIIIEIVSYISQYSSFNYEFFSRYKFPHNRTLGCILEMLPISINGIIFSESKSSKMKSKKTIINYYFFYNI